jgi:VRR-NUC domain
VTERRPTEAQYQRTIIDAARWHGWLVHHQRPARTAKGYRTAIEGDAGFPDLVLVHPQRRQLLFVELKRRPNKLSTHQQAWLGALSATTGDLDSVHTLICWVPDDIDELLARLASGDSDDRTTR